MQTRSLHIRSRTSLPALLLCAILLASGSACQRQPDTTAPVTPASPPAASIGKHTIFESDIDAAIQALPEAMQVQRNDPLLRARVLQVLLRRQALSQQALDLHLDTDPLIQQRIEKARDDILIESLQHWKTRHLPEPNEATIEAYYQAHLNDFTIPEQVHARHILLGSEKQAKQVLRSLRKGKDFAALASEFSRDDVTKPRGGDLNWFPRGVMVKAFEEAAFKLNKAGEVSAPVKTDFGWHIIELLGKKPASLQAVEEARPDIIATLGKQALSAWIKELVEAAGTQILNPQYARQGESLAPSNQP